MIRQRPKLLEDNRRQWFGYFCFLFLIKSIRNEMKWNGLNWIGLDWLCAGCLCISLFAWINKFLFMLKTNQNFSRTVLVQIAYATWQRDRKSPMQCAPALWRLRNEIHQKIFVNFIWFNQMNLSILHRKRITFMIG